MSFLKSKFHLIIPGVYLLAVVVCVVLSFDYKGSISNWTWVLILLTLPWSSVTFFFMWALIHGAGLEYFTLVYLAFGGLNSFLLFQVCNRFRKEFDRRGTKLQRAKEE